MDGEKRGDAARRGEFPKLINDWDVKWSVRDEQEPSEFPDDRNQLVDLVDVACGKIVVKSLPNKRVIVTQNDAPRESKDKAFLFANETLQSKLPILKIAAMILEMACTSVGDSFETKYVNPAQKRQLKIVRRAIERLRRKSKHSKR